MSLKRISIPFFTQLIFEHFAHFFEWKCEEKNVRIFRYAAASKKREKGVEVARYKMKACAIKLKTDFNPVLHVHRFLL